MALRSTEVLPLESVTSTADFKRAVYFIQIPKRFAWEAVLVPEFWRNITMLKTNDLLELVAEDGSWDALARVVAADKGFAVLKVLNLWKAPVEAVQGEAGTVGFILGKGWTLFGTNSSPVATFLNEESRASCSQGIP